MLIEEKARQFYKKDYDANFRYEPSGFDFLSPILEEVNLMRKVLPRDEFLTWLNQFLPKLYKKDFALKPVEVTDRKDGKFSAHRRAKYEQGLVPVCYF